MLEKISLFWRKLKRRKNSGALTETKENTDQTATAALLSRRRELDKKLVYSLNKLKFPTLKQLKHLPEILDKKERRLAVGLEILIAVCLIFIIAIFYGRNFLPAPKIGGEYIEGLIGAPQYLNPLLSQTSDVDADIVRLVFSGLTKFNNQLELAPDLAEKWEKSQDGKTYTFVLKDNLKWHDGEPLTADDVIFTFQSLNDRNFKSPLLASFRGVTAEKVDAKTIKFILAETYPEFLETLTFGILPAHLWEEIPAQNANLAEYNLKPVGSGPWKFKSLAKDKLGNIRSFVLVPNPQYFGKKPYLQKITFKFYPDFETAISAIKNNSAEGMSFLPKELKPRLQGQKSLHYYSLELPQYTAVFFNQKQNDILKEKEVRKALALSVDKEKILTQVLREEGKIINSPILPFDLEPSPDKKIGFDRDLANKTLEDAGWKQISAQDYRAFLKQQQEKAAKADAAATTAEEVQTEPAAVEEEMAPDFYRKKNDKILELAVTTVDQPENMKVAELIKENWQAIGVKVTLRIISGGKISRDVIQPRDYQILIFGIISGSGADPYPFWHSSQTQNPGLNLALLANREVDQILTDAKNAKDEEKQKPLYQRFVDFLATDVSAIFLYSPTYTYAVDEKIKGFDTSRITVPADRFNNLENWYIKTNRIWQGKLR